MRKLFKKFLFVLKIHQTIPLFLRFIGNKQIPFLKKIGMVALLIGYVAIPTDVITDYLPFIGILDDWTVLAFLFDRMKKMNETDASEESLFLEEQNEAEKGKGLDYVG